MTIPAIYSSTALTVAQDTAYDAQSDAYDGSAVKVEPSTGALAQGLLRPGRQVAAQNYNWLMGQFAAIMTQLIADTAAQDVRLDADEAELADHETRLASAETWIANNSPRIRTYEYLTSGTLTVGARVVAALAWGFGGGGAGGGGGYGVFNYDEWLAGAAGGGGSLANTIALGSSFQHIGGVVDASMGGSPTPLIPGTVLNIDIGAGGAPYTATPSGTGGDGGDTIVRYGSQIYATFAGAQGGRGCVGAALPYVTWAQMTMGGMAVRDTQIMLIGNAGQGIRFDTTPGALWGTLGPGNSTTYIPMQPAQGGYGAGVGPTLLNVSCPGGRNPTGGASGGLAGLKAADYHGAGWARGGGGGGGGGAGPLGNGGQGGLGVPPIPSFYPVHVGAYIRLSTYDGYAGGANTGAGGGGGGTGAYVDAYGRGGAGGSGRCLIITVESSP